MKRGLLVVLVLLAAAAAFFYYRNRATTGMTAGPFPDLVMLAPQESSTIIYADVAALRASPFLKRLIALLPPVQQDKDYEEFVRGTGFDYTHDLDQAVVALLNEPASPSTALRAGNPPTDHFAEYSTFVFAAGRFNREKILQYASHLHRQRGGGFFGQIGDQYSAGSNGKVTAFQFSPKNQISLAFGEFDVPRPSGNTIASVSPKEAVFDGSFVFRPGPEMQERIRRVSGSAFFAVGRVEPPRNNSGARKSADWLPDQVSGVVESLRWFTAAARPDGDSLKVALEGECDGALKAQQLSLLLDAFRVLARSALKDPQSRRNLSPEQVVILEHILKNAVISRDGNRVILRFELSSTLLPATPSS